MTLSDNEIDVSTGGLTLDVAGDISLDADGGDVLLKDAGTTFGTLTNDGNNLIVKSGSTTSITLSGANTTLAGTLAVTDATTLNGAVTVSGSNNMTIDAGNLTLSSGSATIGGTLSVTGEITGNASTATKLATARTITIDGDVDATATSFDGTGNITLTTTLDTVNSNVGSFGSATAVPVVTVNAKGLVTAVSTSAITTSLTVGADSGTNDAVSLASDVLNFAGTTNEVETTVSNNQIKIGLPSNVTIGNNLTVTGGISGNVTGDLTGDVVGNVTGTLTGNVTKSSDLSLTSTGGDIILTSSGDDVFMRGTTSNEQLGFNLGSSSQIIESSDNLSIQTDYSSSATTRYLEIKNINPNNDGPIRLVVANDRNIEFRNSSGTTAHSFHVDSTNGAQISLSGTSTITSSDWLALDANTSGSGSSTLYLKANGTTRGSILLNEANTVKFQAPSNTEQLRLTTNGVNVLKGLRVGDGTAPADNDIYAVADIEAGNSFKLGDWTITQSGSSLKFAYQGTNRLSLSSTGALTVENDVTAFGNA